MIDFETYSAAGYPAANKKRGLELVGIAQYATHPSTRIICCAYDVGAGIKLWTPADAPPFDLFDYLRRGGKLDAWNAAFEWWIWQHVCTRLYLWPALEPHQLECVASRARAHALPGSLDKAGEVLKITHAKDKVGKQLINLFSVPTAKTSKKYTLDDMYAYCKRDVEAEQEIAALVPKLSPEELKFWHLDQAINRRGVQIDVDAVNKCLPIFEALEPVYNAELNEITQGAVTKASQVKRLIKWLATQGVHTDKLKDEDLERLLNLDLPDNVRRALEIRELIGNASVRKLYALNHMTLPNGRLHELFLYHSARTGRAAGRGFQPQNLPRAGVPVVRCEACGRHSHKKHEICPYCCGQVVPAEWSREAASDALDVIAIDDKRLLAYCFGGDLLRTISGCLRSVIIAAPGYELICSDYSSIEAVVLAALAGEEWRLETFRARKDIYEISASKITGVPLEEFAAHRAQNKDNPHPLRSKIGKISELSSGYGGSVGAWKQFGAKMTDDEILAAVKAWRRESPRIVKFWYQMDDIAKAAIMCPCEQYSYRGISCVMRGTALYIRLPSGRELTYHNVTISDGQIMYDGYEKGRWVRLKTYGGKLTENVVQAVARDILAHAMLALDARGYRIVMHVHDEIVCEMPVGAGSVEELEQIMSTMPTWANNWPVRAKGGWIGRRYGK